MLISCSLHGRGGSAGQSPASAVTELHEERPASPRREKRRGPEAACGGDGKTQRQTQGQSEWGERAQP